MITSLILSFVLENGNPPRINYGHPPKIERAIEAPAETEKAPQPSVPEKPLPEMSRDDPAVSLPQPLKARDGAKILPSVQDTMPEFSDPIADEPAKAVSTKPAEEPIEFDYPSGLVRPVEPPPAKAAEEIAPKKAVGDACPGGPNCHCALLGPGHNCGLTGCHCVDVPGVVIPRVAQRAPESKAEATKDSTLEVKIVPAVGMYSRVQKILDDQHIDGLVESKGGFVGIITLPQIRQLQEHSSVLTVLIVGTETTPYDGTRRLVANSPKAAMGDDPPPVPKQTCTCPNGPTCATCGGIATQCVAQPKSAFQPGVVIPQPPAVQAPRMTYAAPKQWVASTTYPGFQGYGVIDSGGYLTDVTEWRQVAQPYTYAAPATRYYAAPASYGYAAGVCAPGTACGQAASEAYGAKRGIFGFGLIGR